MRNTVHPDRWYLDAARIPAGVAVEAGQAVRLLAGYLGVDFVLSAGDRLMWDCLALSCPVVLCVEVANFPVQAISEIVGCSIPRPELLCREVQALFDNSVLYAQRVWKGWEAASQFPLLSELAADWLAVDEPLSKHEIAPSILKAV